MGERVGYAAAALVASALVAAVSVVIDYNGLRGGALPWGMTGLAASASVIVWEIRRRRIGQPSALLVVASLAVQAVLISMAAFFLSVAVLNVAHSGILRHTDGGAATVATLLGSVEIMVLLPLGLIGIAVAVWRDRQLRQLLRLLPVVILVVFAIGPILVGALPDSTERPVMIGWLAAVAGTWVALASELARFT